MYTRCLIRLCCSSMPPPDKFQPIGNHPDDERFREWLRNRKLDRSLARFVLAKFMPEKLYGRGMGIESNMVCISGNHDLLVAFTVFDQAECRDVVVERFNRIGSSLEDVRAELKQCLSCCLRLGLNIVINCCIRFRCAHGSIPLNSASW